MQNEIYPGFVKLQSSDSPKFANASKMQASKVIAPGNFVASEISDDNYTHDILQNRTLNPDFAEKSNNLKTTKRNYRSQSSGSSARDFIPSEDLDNLELCIPHSNVAREFDRGNNMLTGACCDSYSVDAISADRRRKGHGRRCNRNVERSQVNWPRNITATMERFEPAQSNRPPSSASSLDYGFAASVVTSAAELPHCSQITHPLEVPKHDIEMLRGVGSMNHVYSYAYYEPGSVKCHSNNPRNNGQMLNTTTMRCNNVETSKNAHRNSIRTLLSKGFRSKSIAGQSISLSPSPSPSPCVEDRHTYTTRYGTTENLYEEVNDQKIGKVLSDNRIEVSAANNVKEEFRRVQHNHFRVLDELNLSLEALIMPPSPLNLSPNNRQDMEDTTGKVDISVAIGNISTPSTVSSSSPNLPQKPRRFGLLGGDSSSLLSSGQSHEFSNNSLENVSVTFHSMDLKDRSHNSTNNPEFDEGDLDSGFSGSGSSSGASCNESLRDYKIGNTLLTRNQSLLHKKHLCYSPTSSGSFALKTSVASHEDVVPGNKNNEVTSFVCVHRCSDTNKLSMPSTSTGTKSKNSFWSMKS
ncbi:putative mediator of RNA polymerase II transcription subunit 26 [Anastrepha obliqua]|uniref:putative mediator of RNA polymerase II transcription subunit 26 n=1 Tax=Anastrepha obliqua TaxID=95512 RepID=UPI00240907F1|nr:putative mediator of RNA polymerase II transcription subunit 26 [Anastrepha obliqua]